MEYSSDTIKKAYRDTCDIQRSVNLIRLREEIAKLSQAEFIRKVGFTKSDISNLETGSKTLSLYQLHAYKTFFKEKHDVNVSADFLMGYTDIMENDNMKTQSEIGLSADSLKTLQNLNEKAGGKTMLEVLNQLMERQDLFEALLGNIEIILRLHTWHPAIAACPDGPYNEFAEVTPISENQFLSFIRIPEGKEYDGVLLIDENILSSSAMVTIQNILNKYLEG